MSESMTEKIQARLEELGLELPTPPKPAGSYAACVADGRTLYLAGTVSPDIHDFKPKGKVGRDLTTEQGYQCARGAVLNHLATLLDYLGSFDRIKQFVKVVGFVNCTEDFAEQPKVVNGASDLLGELFGERGTHARSAVGVAALPFNAPVEVEMIVAVEER